MKYSPYSWSKLETYIQCPAKFKFKYIERIKIHQKPEDRFNLEKGDYQHKLLEQMGSTFPPIDYYRDVLHEQDIINFNNAVRKFIMSDKGIAIMSMPCIGNEIQFGVDAKFQPSAYWDDNTVYRGVIDKLCLDTRTGDALHMFDYKTGKVKDKEWIPDFNQQKSYIAWVFVVFPHINCIKINYVYIEHDEIIPFVYFREDLPEVINELKQNIITIENDCTHKKNIQRLCDWCEYAVHCQADNT